MSVPTLSLLKCQVFLVVEAYGLIYRRPLGENPSFTFELFSAVGSISQINKLENTFLAALDLWSKPLCEMGILKFCQK